MMDLGSQDHLQTSYDDGDSDFNLADEENYLDTSKPRSKRGNRGGANEPVKPAAAPRQVPWMRSQEFRAMQR